MKKKEIFFDSAYIENKQRLKSHYNAIKSHFFKKRFFRKKHANFRLFLKGFDS
jgi:hypothetical protein